MPPVDPNGHYPSYDPDSLTSGPTLTPFSKYLPASQADAMDRFSRTTAGKVLTGPLSTLFWYLPQNMFGLIGLGPVGPFLLPTTWVALAAMWTVKGISKVHQARLNAQFEDDIKNGRTRLDAGDQFYSESAGKTYQSDAAQTFLRNAPFSAVEAEIDKDGNVVLTNRALAGGKNTVVGLQEFRNCLVASVVRGPAVEEVRRADIALEWLGKTQAERISAPADLVTLKAPYLEETSAKLNQKGFFKAAGATEPEVDQAILDRLVKRIKPEDLASGKTVLAALQTALEAEKAATPAAAPGGVPDPILAVEFKDDLSDLSKSLIEDLRPELLDLANIQKIADTPDPARVDPASGPARTAAEKDAETNALNASVDKVITQFNQKKTKATAIIAEADRGVAGDLKSRLKTTLLAQHQMLQQAAYLVHGNKENFKDWREEIESSREAIETAQAALEIAENRRDAHTAAVAAGGGAAVMTPLQVRDNDAEIAKQEATIKENQELIKSFENLIDLGKGADKDNQIVLRDVVRQSQIARSHYLEMQGRKFSTKPRTAIKRNQVSVGLENVDYTLSTWQKMVAAVRGGNADVPMEYTESHGAQDARRWKFDFKRAFSEPDENGKVTEKIMEIKCQDRPNTKLEAMTQAETLISLAAKRGTPKAPKEGSPAGTPFTMRMNIDLSDKEINEILAKAETNPNARSVKGFERSLASQAMYETLGEALNIKVDPPKAFENIREPILGEMQKEAQTAVHGRIDEYMKQNFKGLSATKFRDLPALEKAAVAIDMMKLSPAEAKMYVENMMDKHNLKTTYDQFIKDTHDYKNGSSGAGALLRSGPGAGAATPPPAAPGAATPATTAPSGHLHR